MIGHELYEFTTTLGPLCISRYAKWVALSATEGTEEATMSFTPDQARGIAATLIRLADEVEQKGSAA